MTKLCNTQDIFLTRGGKKNVGEPRGGGRAGMRGWGHDDRSRSPRRYTPEGYEGWGSKGGYNGYSKGKGKNYNDSDYYGSRKGKGKSSYDSDYGAYSKGGYKGRDAAYSSFDRSSSWAKGGKKGNGKARNGRKGREEPTVSIADLDNALEDYFGDGKPRGGGKSGGKASNVSEKVLDDELDSYMGNNDAKKDTNEDKKSKSAGVLKEDDPDKNNEVDDDKKDGDGNANSDAKDEKAK
mmetsp:Transcript_43340/g.119901  ORF Transcript_43340/g.119901 Transcript_43340/m.119901 type:complete len:237 (-) Transcript_43340:86-796(-)|eukprot:CAMPEP_0117523728 /NCGR_PEP_ID=MMETSP0784-20121206/34877_1 /TAXON_ID=39447 /ORGANISM="" /LENGTH=236 /DNA_ID=CAMNT_0005319849 /DNA_START=37 /DNA_END=747 /DNA_ORIENTATION=-